MSREAHLKKIQDSRPEWVHTSAPDLLSYIEGRLADAFQQIDCLNENLEVRRRMCEERDNEIAEQTKKLLRRFGYPQHGLCGLANAVDQAFNFVRRVEEQRQEYLDRANAARSKNAELAREIPALKRHREAITDNELSTLRRVTEATAALKKALPAANHITTLEQAVISAVDLIRVYGPRARAPKGGDMADSLRLLFDSMFSKEPHNAFCGVPPHAEAYKAPIFPIELFPSTERLQAALTELEKISAAVAKKQAQPFDEYKLAAGQVWRAPKGEERIIHNVIGDTIHYTLGGTHPSTGFKHALPCNKFRDLIRENRMERVDRTPEANPADGLKIQHIEAGQTWVAPDGQKRIISNVRPDGVVEYTFDPACKHCVSNNHTISIESFRRRIGYDQLVLVKPAPAPTPTRNAPPEHHLEPRQVWVNERHKVSYLIRIVEANRVIYEKYEDGFTRTQSITRGGFLSLIKLRSLTLEQRKQPSPTQELAVGQVWENERFYERIDALQFNGTGDLIQVRCSTNDTRYNSGTETRRYDSGTETRWVSPRTMWGIIRNNNLKLRAPAQDPYGIDIEKDQVWVGTNLTYKVLAVDRSDDDAPRVCFEPTRDFMIHNSQCIGERRFKALLQTHKMRLSNPRIQGTIERTTENKP